MRFLATVCIVFSATLLAMAGCEQEREKAAVPDTPQEEKEVVPLTKGESAPPAKETQGEEPAADTTNAALNKSYTVSPKPKRHAEIYTTAATDGRKPPGVESCFGYLGASSSLDVALDIDLGDQEEINGATLYTFLNTLNETSNVCNYGANYVEIYGSESGDFWGEENLLGSAGNEKSDFGDPGRCVFTIEFDPVKCRYVRFLINKKFGEPGTSTDWLFIKEAEVRRTAE